MIKHKLIIKCYHDAQAECICGNWHMVFTGELTKEEIKKEFNKHLGRERNYRKRKNRKGD